MDLHRSGEAEKVERLYRAILAADPDHPDALHYLGLLLHAGAADESLALIERSVARQPDFAPSRLNLGNILFERDRSGSGVPGRPRGRTRPPRSSQQPCRGAARWGGSTRARRATGAPSPSTPLLFDAHENLGRLLVSRERHGGRASGPGSSGGGAAARGGVIVGTCRSVMSPRRTRRGRGLAVVYSGGGTRWSERWWFGFLRG
jgi:hypothetical protein